MTNQDFLTTKQAAIKLGVSLPTVQAWVESGVLPAWKTVGGHRRIPLDAIEFMLVKQQEAMDAARPTRAFKVLAVDDALVQRELYRAQISAIQHSIQLYLASDGFDALMMIERHQPDLILADLVMPGVDGFALVRKLQTTQFRHSIIVITGLSQDQIDAQGGLPKTIQVVQKPVPAVELKLIVEERLRRSRSVSLN
jgi:excisionase family DNA binding protein